MTRKPPEEGALSWPHRSPSSTDERFSTFPDNRSRTSLRVEPFRSTLPPRRSSCWSHFLGLRFCGGVSSTGVGGRSPAFAKAAAAASASGELSSVDSVVIEASSSSWRASCAASAASAACAASTASSANGGCALSCLSSLFRPKSPDSLPSPLASLLNTLLSSAFSTTSSFFFSSFFSSSLTGVAPSLTNDDHAAGFSVVVVSSLGGSSSTLGLSTASFCPSVSDDALRWRRWGGT
mmetsp:Transcript_17755/g.46595  ORF Transcript_17755/g.46595 Transcript_17755/m.46595 type:complete len:236 (-) Transcript_17755:437-1144(-)